MKSIQYDVTVDDVQRRIIVKALDDLKLSQIKQGKSYDFIDQIILKFSEEKAVKRKRRFYETR